MSLIVMERRSDAIRRLQDQKGEGLIDAFDHMVLELLLESDEMTLDEAVAEADRLVAADAED
jgi:hypothetical protein